MEDFIYKEDYKDFPKLQTLDFVDTNKDNLSFIFVGCWGVYCSAKDQMCLGYNKDKNIFDKEKNCKFGQYEVVKLMEEFSNTANIEAVILGGDNVYSDPTPTSLIQKSIIDAGKPIKNILEKEEFFEAIDTLFNQDDASIKDKGKANEIIKKYIKNTYHNVSSNPDEISDDDIIMRSIKKKFISIHNISDKIRLIDDDDDDDKVKLKIELKIKLDSLKKKINDNTQLFKLSSTEKEQKKTFKKAKSTLYNIERQLSDGFSNCMESVKTENFFVGIGNHDIENCDVIRYQLQFQNKRWKMPALSYNVLYKNKDFNVNLIFIDTNMYEEGKWCSGNYTSDAEQKQEEWVKKVLSETDDKTWNIVIGHVPFICNPHKIQDDIAKTRIVKGLYKLIENNRHKIHLYMCADEHNQHYIKYIDETGNNFPPQIICGSGGTKLDEKIYKSKSLKQDQIKLARSVFGFVSLQIDKKNIAISFHSIDKTNTKIFNIGYESPTQNESIEPPEPLAVFI